MAGEAGAVSRAELERVVLPHLDAAYNLARWLVRNEEDAEDVVQDACLRAVRFIGGYRGGEARAWLLRIVRNSAYDFLQRKRPSELAEEFDETLHVFEGLERGGVEADLGRAEDNKLLRAALEVLPVQFREVLILRELEGLSYKEISDVMQIPIGTVMSSLARARERLRERLLATRSKEVRHDL